MRADVDLLRGGAEDFGVFYERHVGMVTAYVGRRVRRPELTIDLVAETFARALERRLQFDARRWPRRPG
ncbi:hypothetical protein DVA67_000340 [Solirubrobacter sp. CPCC 204708]|uniref:RNA polymerase sigma-70 region 2 domain-containing protein n=1 Tax=Solirubrobacter deserti TaxID=2282478 RepID=A0ABT4RLW2_9ACTN|nr:sigma factor [Solirubrobacter deserti]MBE2314405.1 hypothetical protein [Solirubrobacter deserti]MDA0139552.1 hypothetical protein [Solirubrobacter deserti]